MAEVIDRRVILGVQWADGEPLVRLREGGEAVSELVPLIGLHLGYRTDAGTPRVCVGHKPLRTTSRGSVYVDCTQRAQAGTRTCRSCAIAEATFASNLHHAHTKPDVGSDPDMAIHLRQPNLLYLAAFRDGSVKVGTTTERRRQTRLAEQGAWLARFVGWTGDGVTVRRLEDRVTRELGLPQSVTAVRKMDGLLRPVDDDRLVSQLDVHRDAVQQLLVKAESEQARVLDEPWSNPRMGSGNWTGLHRYPASLGSGAHDLEIIDACGRLLVVKRPSKSDHFLVDLQQLYGVEIEIGAFGSEPLAVQDRLF